MSAREPSEPWDEDYERHARLIALLRDRPASRAGKLQRRLHALEELWREILPGCFRRMVVHPRRGIVPGAAEVECVARFAGHPSPAVRRCVLELMRHAKTHRALALPVVRAGLGDPELPVRLQAARAAWELGAGAALGPELLAALESPTWTLRWYAAAALAATPQRDRAAEVLAASFPAKVDAPGAAIHVSRWVELAGAFTPPTPAIAALLARLREPR